jgi:hypothetical protein
MYREGYVIDPSIAQTHQGYLLPVAMPQCRLVTMRYFRFTLFRQGTSLDHLISEDDAWWVPLLAGSAVEDMTYNPQWTLGMLTLLAATHFTRPFHFRKQAFYQATVKLFIPGSAWAAYPILLHAYVCVRATTDVMCRHAYVRCLRTPSNTRIKRKYSA